VCIPTGTAIVESVETAGAATATTGSHNNPAIGAGVADDLRSAAATATIKVETVGTVSATMSTAYTPHGVTADGQCHCLATVDGGAIHGDIGRQGVAITARAARVRPSAVAVRSVTANGQHP
jgi:hypothetical protein